MTQNCQKQTVRIEVSEMLTNKGSKAELKICLLEKFMHVCLYKQTIAVKFEVSLTNTCRACICNVLCSR